MSPDTDLDRERRDLLAELEVRLELPMVVLGFAWLVLLVIELAWGLNAVLEVLTAAIWIIFIADFVLKLVLAQNKGRYLVSNWLTAVSLLLPALRVFRIARVFRILRVARASRGLRLVRVLTTLNRGMGALGASMGRRGFGYVMALTLIVTLAGAAGMHAFERENSPGQAFATYMSALWWTAMMMTTMASEFWPRTTEGRLLCLLLALYAFAVFGYVTAALASFFVEREAQQEASDVPSARSIAELRSEMVAVRTELANLRRDIRA